MPTMGAANANTTNRMPTTMFDKPVRAPAAAPDVDSTKLVTELAPMKPPTAAAAESTRRMGWMSATSPFSSTKSACSPTATTVPMVSKKSLMSRENTNKRSAGCKNTCTIAMVSVPGMVWKGAANAEKSSPKFQEVGSCVTPRGMPTMVATMMEMSRPPLTLSTWRMTAIAMATSDTMATGEDRSPSPRMVDSFATMTPPPFKPMNAMNSPMPMPMAWRRLTGMASMTALRKPHATRTRMTRPSRNTIAMATRQSTEAPPRHSVYATMALMPMPEARAIGLFAMRPIAMVMTAAPKHVAVSAASNGTPATTSMFGLTAMM